MSSSCFWFQANLLDRPPGLPASKTKLEDKLCFSNMYIVSLYSAVSLFENKKKLTFKNEDASLWNCGHRFPSLSGGTRNMGLNDKIVIYRSSTVAHL